MTNRGQESKHLFEQGYNCAQAVLAASCDATGMDRDTALRAGAPFGGGMGRMREVCGAVTGMFLVAGLLYGGTDPEDREGRTAHYKLIQELAEQFKERHGSIICRDLLARSGPPESPAPDLRTEAYYTKRPCARFVESAGQILDALIEKKEKETSS